MTKNTFDIVIPSFNGKHLLAKQLPEVIKNSNGFSRIIVIDDGSSDDTKEFLKKKFPKVYCLANNENLGFTKSVNLGFAISTSNHVVLINNDVYPKKGYLESPLNYLNDESIFAVTFNEENSSWPLVSWREGKFQYVRGEDKNKPRFSAWASGGSAIFNRRIWNELGGFDKIFSPGYWEDIDIGWRAWKAGYKIIWDPKSYVIHQHESTFKTLSFKYVSLIKERNELLFTWKNITDKKLLATHLAFLARYTATHPGYIKVIFAALKKISKIEKPQGKLSDKEILSLVNRPL